MFNNGNKQLIVFSINFLFLMFCFSQARAMQDFSYNQHYYNLHKKYPSIEQHLLTSGLKAFEKANNMQVTKKPILTLVDYSKPSDEKRMWVIDLESDTVLFRDFVSHGQRSGDRYATRFSNKPGSHQSSFGVFITQEPYHGSHGYSLRLNGLEKGVNDQARSRAIVMHSAWYVTKQFAARYGRVGRSFGCFAVNENIIRPLINTIRNGSLLVAFYPNPSWLRNSMYVS